MWKYLSSGKYCGRMPYGRGVPDQSTRYAALVGTYLVSRVGWRGSMGKAFANSTQPSVQRRGKYGNFATTSEGGFTSHGLVRLERPSGVDLRDIHALVRQWGLRIGIHDPVGHVFGLLIYCEVRVEKLPKQRLVLHAKLGKVGVEHG